MKSVVPTVPGTRAAPLQPLAAANPLVVRPAELSSRHDGIADPMPVTRLAWKKPPFLPKSRAIRDLFGIRAPRAGRPF
jgi:hypothetical protein